MYFYCGREALYIFLKARAVFHGEPEKLSSPDDTTRSSEDGEPEEQESLPPPPPTPPQRSFALSGARGNWRQQDNYPTFQSPRQLFSSTVTTVQVEHCPKQDDTQDVNIMLC